MIPGLRSETYLCLHTQSNTMPTMSSSAAAPPIDPDTTGSCSLTGNGVVPSEI